MIPKELKEQRRWACWGRDFENRYGVTLPEKAPMVPVAGQPFAKGISSTVPSEWLEYDLAQAWAERDGCGIGIMLGPDMLGNGADWVGVDLDTYKLVDRDPLKQQLAELVDRCPGYVESSPSGGVRILIRGLIPRSRKAGAIELYRNKRFLRMTGDVLTPAGEHIAAQGWLDELVAIIGEGSDAATEEFEFGDMQSPDAARETFERVLASMHHGDRIVIGRADRGEVLGSDACSQICIAFAKNDVDAATALICLIAMEGVQKHYADKFGDKAPAELNRKFCNYWWPQALAKAPAAIERDRAHAEADAEQLAACGPQIRAMVAASEAKRERIRLEVVNGDVPTLAEHATAQIPPMFALPDTPLFNLVADNIERNMTRASPDWLAINSLFFVGLIASNNYTMSGDSICLPIVPCSDTGGGKGMAKKLLETLIFEDESAPRGPDPNYNIQSQIKSGEAIRDICADGRHAIVLLGDAGEVLSGISASRGNFVSLNAYLPNMIDGSADFGTAGAKGQYAQSHQSPVIGPRLSLYLPVQHDPMMEVMTERYVTSGIAGRMIHLAIDDYGQLGRPVTLVGERKLDPEFRKMFRRFSKRRTIIETAALNSSDEFDSFIKQAFPPLPGKLNKVRSRVGHGVLKLATVCAASRMLMDDNPRAELVPSDLDFGVAVMRHHYEYLQWLAFSGMSGISTIAQRDLNVLIAIRKTAEEAQKDARRNGGDAVIRPSRVRHHLPRERKADFEASAALLGEFAIMGRVVERTSRRGSSFAISLGFFGYIDDQIALLRRA